MPSSNNSQNKKLFTGSVWLVALAGALGVGLQNFLAFLSFLLDLGRIGPQLAQALAITLGGAVSGVVNLWMNLGLLNDFFKRLTGETSMPKLQGWKKFRYWAGSLVFIVTGVLFGMTAFAFGGVGVLASIGIAAGILVAAIMMIQELETWLSSFDEKKKAAPHAVPLSFSQTIQAWWKNLTPAKSTALVISLGNVLALSLLFAFGLTSFLTMTGVPLIPAITVAFVVSFTAGAFTEFYFYHFFLAKFCQKIDNKFNKFMQLSTDKKLLGIISVSLNAATNAALAYAGIVLLNTVLATAGMSALPMVVIIVAAVFSGLASFILGSNFWLRALSPSKTAPSAELGGSSQGAAISPSGATRPSPSLVRAVLNATGEAAGVPLLNR